MTQPTPLSSDDNALTKPAEAGPAVPGDSPFVVPPEPKEDLFAATRQWLLELADEAERIDHDLPADLAENLDHYLHGLPRK